MKQLILIPLMFLGACAATETATHESSAMQTAVQDGGGMEDMGATAEQMAAMMKFATPGEAHAEIAKMAGSWTSNMQMYPAPGAPAMEMTFDSEMKMILGGRYLCEEVGGDFMGMPFEGFMLLGYNNGTEEYFSVWLDNFGTGLTWATGKQDERGVMHQSGTMQHAEDPAGSAYRSEMVMESDDAFSVTMYGSLPDGSEFKMMDMAYTRKRPAKQE